MRRLFIILVGLPMTWFSEKMIIFNICRHYLTPNLIKNSWRVLPMTCVCSRQEPFFFIYYPLGRSVFILQTIYELCIPLNLWSCTIFFKLTWLQSLWGAVKLEMILWGNRFDQNSNVLFCPIVLYNRAAILTIISLLFSSKRSLHKIISIFNDL